MRNSWIIPLAAVLAVTALVEPALAQTAPSNPYNVSWSALSPGNDWAAQVIQSLFPVTGTTASPGTSPGQETTVTYRYSLSTGDESGNPACGTVTVRESLQNQQTVAGVSIDMAAVQQANLVQKWLGHAQLTTTAIYANAVGAEEKDIARRMWSCAALQS